MQTDLYLFRRRITAVMKKLNKERSQSTTNEKGTVQRQSLNLVIVSIKSLGGKIAAYPLWNETNILLSDDSPSMNSTNELISGDNKGYASYLLDKTLNPNGTCSGKGDIVASNLEDISPTTSGLRCIDIGLPCDGSWDRQSGIFIAYEPRSDS